MSDVEDGPRISLHIKSTTATHDISVKDNATVSEVKDTILTKVPNATKEQLCLIFSGKILKDHETLKSHKIGDDMAIHLVVRQGAARATPPAASTAASTPSATPASTTAQSATSTTPGASMFGGAFPGMGAQAGAGNMQGMAQQMMSNPDMMRQMMDNPLMQNILSNPDIMRSMLANNPQIQNIIERNPEVGHILNDPDVMRQTMEMIRNPNMFQEMMRNHDLAIRNLQGIPGGEAHLQRLYQDVQEPLLNSATGSLGGNPYSSNSNGGTEDATSRSQRAGVENREALPNPWGGAASTPRSTAGGGNEENATPNGGGGAAGGASPFAGMMGTPGMDSLMQQMMSDPNIMQSVMNPEMMNMLQQQMQANPQMIQQIMESNPMVANNPELAQQLRSQMPQLMNMVNRPEMMQAFTNPRVVEAIRQIQQGTETIRREAPELARTFFGGFPGGAAPTSTTGAPTATTGTPSSGGSGGSAGTGANPMGGVTPEMLNMMRNMMGGMNMGGAGGAAPAPVANPEETYSAQLEQLSNMGFSNRARNIAALSATFGDLNAAVERLLNSP